VYVLSQSQVGGCERVLTNRKKREKGDFFGVNGTSFELNAILVGKSFIQL
jgi:hypothetical protein